MRRRQVCRVTLYVILMIVLSALFILAAAYTTLNIFGTFTPVVTFDTAIKGILIGLGVGNILAYPIWIILGIFAELIGRLEE